MKLFINYLHRELTETVKDGKKVRTIFNDRQRVFDDYTFEISFVGRMEGKEERFDDCSKEDFKQKVKDALLELYLSGRADIDEFPYNWDGDEKANCIAFRFDDEDEKFGEEVYLQHSGETEKYYNLPPIDRKGIHNAPLDPRTFISGLIFYTEIFDHMISFEIKYRNVTWLFESPDYYEWKEKDQFDIWADRIWIKETTSTGIKEYMIDDSHVVMPNAYQLEFIPKLSPYTTKFAVLACGDWYVDEEEKVTFDFMPDLQYVSPNEMRIILSGEMRLGEDWNSGAMAEDSQDEGDHSMTYSGEFCSNGMKKDFSYLPKEYDYLRLLDIYPMNVVEKVNDTNLFYAEETLYGIHSDLEKLSNAEDGAITECMGSYNVRDVDLDEEDRLLKQYGVAVQAANRKVRMKALRSKAEVRAFEQEVFGGTELESVELENYEMDDTYPNPAYPQYNYHDENWTMRYEGKKTICTVFYWAEYSQRSGILVKSVRFENRLANEEANKASGVSCEVFVDFKNRIVDQNIHVDKAYLDGGWNKEDMVDKLTDLRSAMDYFEGALASQVERIVGKKGKERDLPAGYIRRSSYDGNPKFAALYQCLRSEKGDMLDYGEDILSEIARCVGHEWLDTMNEAAGAGLSVRRYMEGRFADEKKNYVAPSVHNIAIMGEAGVGKTTLARQIAKKCLGAEFMEVTGEALKGSYIGWTDKKIGSMIFELQKKATIQEKDKRRVRQRPAVLFIDEVYTLFEQNKNGEHGTAGVMETLLKLAEPGECTIEIGDFDEKDAKNMGLMFQAADLKPYMDEEYYAILKDNWVRVRKVLKNENTVIWLGGYEDRLRSSFAANEGLNSRFDSKLIIPTPKVDELMRLFKMRLTKMNGRDGVLLDEESEKEIRKFLKWASSRSFSRLFGNRRGIDQLTERFEQEYYLSEGDLSKTLSEVLRRYQAELQKQYKAELMMDLPKMPFESVTQVDDCLDDYAGNERLKRRIREIIDMMLCNEKYQARNVSLPKGALLMGPPGTGKTMIAKCMAGELQLQINEEALRDNQKDVVFIPTSGAEILATPNPVKAISVLFSEAKEYDAAIIFIDEIDSIGKKRDRQGNPAPLLQLMKEMDGFGDLGNIFVLAATNDPDSLDDALVRDGRFDIRLEVGLPDRESSEALIRHYLKNYGIDYDSLSNARQKRFRTLLAGRVPASVRAYLNEAAILYYRCEELMLGRTDEELAGKYPLELAHRRNGDGSYQRSKNYDFVSISDLDLFLRDLKESMDSKEIGLRKENQEEEESFTLRPDANGGASSVAIHEAGHALVGMLLGRMDIERITILGRGNAAGYVEHKSDNYAAYTKEDFQNQIKIAMGGRVAEELIYGADRVSIGASEDIQKATNIAGKMVKQFGFSEAIGFLGIERGGRGYLGEKLKTNVSQGMMDLADQETMRILFACMEETRKLLGENRELLIGIAQKLFESKEMSGDEIEEIYRKGENLITN